MTKIVLYNVTIARKPRAKALAIPRWPEKFLACVHAKDGHVAGHTIAGIEGLVQPDWKAVRDALPANLRKAWDRPHTAWYPRDHARIEHMPNPNTACHVSLRDTRGRMLAQIIAVPYLYPSKTQPEEK